MRLGSPLPTTWDSPDGWVGTLREKGFRAAYWPLPDGAPADEVRAYAGAAESAGIVIAEIGAWGVNPISAGDAARAAAIEHCQTQLALADAVGARCCVTLSGSRAPEWNSPHPENLTEETFALIVDSVREIIDGVQPQRTHYTLEPMPYTLPDSPDSYLELIRAIDRDRFAVHLDPTNLINSPAKFYDHPAFLRECVDKLGPYVKSVHVKDLELEHELTVHLAERIPGQGGLDFGAMLTELDRLPEDTPILVEHLTTAEEYEQAVAGVRRAADALGLTV
jgi:sugar phosphate isomerase/epimerase